MDIALDMQPTLRQWVSPRMIEANHILSLSLTELEQTVHTELQSNPALELEEGPQCPRCGARLDGPYCVICRLDQRLDNERGGEDDVLYSERMANNGTAQPTDDDFDPMTLIASEASLVEQIMADVSTLLPAGDVPIAEYIVNNLDDRGYLEIAVEHIAELVKRSVDEIEHILRAVQQVAPIGVAARDLRECLMLQLTFLAQQREEETEIPSAVWRIVSDHLADLAAHRYSLIARRLSLSSAEVAAAHEYIRSHLNPYPLQNQEARWWKTTTRTAYVAPDVIVTLRDNEFQVELVQSRSTRLRLDPLYAALSTNGQNCTSDDRTHIRHHVARARLFIANINQRYETLRKVTECLLELQGDFVREGVRSLRPLTRSQVAEYVGVHESTVSRATANKYIMLPNRDVIPFSTFFVASLSTKDIIKEMISGEQRALTDQEICDRLLSQGVRIARRTVAKYRTTIGIAPSMMRPSAHYAAQVAL